MKALFFIYEIYKKFPFALIYTTFFLIGASTLNSLSLLTMGPLVDLFLDPELKQVNPLTHKAINILSFIGIPTTLGSWVFVFLTFILMSSLFQIFSQYSIFRMKYTVLQDLMIKTLEDFFNARWDFFSNSRQGVFLNTFTHELTVVGNAFASMAFFFANIFQVLFLLAVPFYLSWKVTIISIGSTVLLGFPFYLLGKFSYRLGQLNTRTANELSDKIHETLGLIKIVLGFGRQRKSIENLESAYDAYRQVAIKSQTLNSAIPILYRPLSMVMVIIALLTSRQVGIPLSEIIVLLWALFQASLFIGNLTMQKNALENFFPSYEQLKNLKNQALRMKQPSGRKRFMDFEKEIIIKNLSFSYLGQPPVLSDINIRIPKGKMVAFVGKSGAGKSTLIDIIMGFYEVAVGCIIFDDTPLEEYDVYSYRNRIGYVPQDNVLFNMSIRDNLMWANSAASDHDFKKVCQLAYVDEFVSQFKDGYETMVGDRGMRLSGGQIQRVALARALLRKPVLLILDEATSSLDTHSERLIQKAIENITKETTVIAVAHRLSTIKNADYIYVLEKGGMVEEGKYPQLMYKKGFFNSMVKLQKLEILTSR